MPSTPIAQDAHGYLRESRRAVLATLDGLGERDVRRPLTPTGTNLLGVVKHLVGIEAGYLGACLARPFPEPLPWLDALDTEPNADMFATAAESTAYLTGLYERATAHADATLAEVGLDAPAEVSWWAPDVRRTTAAALLARVLKDTAMHAGQLQIVRELIDGRGGTDQGEAGDGTYWSAHVARLQAIADGFTPRSVS